jgi:hypothetical protein
MPWLETAVWQQAQGEDGRFVAQGRLWLAPGNRQRLELTVRVGQTEGKLRMVSDGKVLQRVTCVGQDAPNVWQQIVVTDPSPGEGDDSVLGNLAEGGLDRLLVRVRQRLTDSRVRRASWKGQAVYRITGGWRSDMPRTCVVLLDVRTLWPHRIAWTGERDSWQVEFRDPQPNQPLTPAQSARLFAVAPSGD